ncbi:GNAT family N-acetyltransferase [Enterovibrio norvegicus]|uniref:GNAT family N-acetyltransferase n=1 Tax=Enterovibrio norvegicus TaxID=188144 RepID=UPI000C84E23A|nr:GNAT family N-acetyltransferase [Enterovibrio norvegicus]PMN68319.1 hypothetical protein BCT27_24050 [Enterovibrio norvegicus]
MSMTTLQRSSLDDLALILPLVADYHAFEEIESTESMRENAVRKLLNNPDFGCVWLIYSDGHLAGYIALCLGFSIEFNGFDAFVDEFFLSKSFRGKGIGTEVLVAIKREARKLDVKALHLEVAKRNTSAQMLYSKAGFIARDKYVLMSLAVENDDDHR